MEAELASKMSCFKKLDDGWSPKKDRVSLLQSCSVLSFVYTWHGDAGPRFLRMLHFREIWFGMAQFSASYTNLGQPHIFKHQV